MTRVVLGSASSGRLRVLRQAGINPVVVVSGFDEYAVAASLPPDAGPGTVVSALAAAKAHRVAMDLGPPLAADCVVIGCDSMLWFNGQLRGKPPSIEAARDAWQSMGGYSGELYTGHCLLRLRSGAITQTAVESASTTVHFARPAQVDLDRYLASGEPLSVAGAFTLDGLGGWFIDRVEGDPSIVIGIGLAVTRQLMQQVGLSVTALWRDNPT